MSCGPASCTTTGHVYDAENEQNGDSRGVWKVRSIYRNDRHPAEFPEDLARRAIRLWPQLASLLALFFWTRPSSSANNSGLVSAVPEAPTSNTNKPSTEDHRDVGAG